MNRLNKINQNNVLIKSVYYIIPLFANVSHNLSSMNHLGESLQRMKSICLHDKGKDALIVDMGRCVAGLDDASFPSGWDEIFLLCFSFLQ